MPYVETDFETPLSLTTGRFYRIKFKDPASIGHLRLAVYNQVTKSPAAGESYRLEGNGAAFSGSVDAKGEIRHPGVPGGYYTLVMGDAEYAVPTVDKAEDVHTVFVVVDPGPGRENDEDLPDVEEHLEPLSEEESESLLAEDGEEGE